MNIERLKEPKKIKAKVYRASQLETYPIPYEIVEFMGFIHFFLWQREQGAEVIFLAQKYYVAYEPDKADKTYYCMWSNGKRGSAFLKDSDNCHCAIMVLDKKFDFEEK